MRVTKEEHSNGEYIYNLYFEKTQESNVLRHRLPNIYNLIDDIMYSHEKTLGYLGHEYSIIINIASPIRKTKFINEFFDKASKSISKTDEGIINVREIFTKTSDTVSDTLDELIDKLNNIKNNKFK